MRYLVLLIFALGHTLLAFGQTNLVLNPSFENASGIFPCYSDLTNGTWTEPTNNTTTSNPSPDLWYPGTTYSEKCTNNSISTPSSGAQDGDRFAGIQIFAGGADGREYITATLETPLLACVEYNVTYYYRRHSYINNPESSAESVGGTVCDNLGVKFHDDLNIPLPNNNPDLNINSIMYNTDWAMFSGTYVASGGETYMSIGNFYLDNQTSSQVLLVTNQQIGYYAIDNVSVTPVLDPCTTTSLIEDVTYNPFTTTTENDIGYIEAGYDVGIPGQGYVIHQADATVDYIAARAIELHPGFSANGGNTGHFLACVDSTSCVGQHAIPVTPIEPLNVCIGVPTLLDVVCVPGVYHWEIEDENGVITTLFVAPYPVCQFNFVPTQLGTFTIWLTIVDPCGNETVVEIPVTVFPDDCLVRGGEGGLRLEEAEITDASDISNEVTISPNPSRGIFNINMLETGGTARVYNLMGELIAEWSFEDQPMHQLDLSEHPPGMYILTVDTQNTTYSERLLITE